MQRVLLFTEDFVQAARAQEAGEFERIDMEIVLNMEGAGLSMVDNARNREIAYLGVTRYIIVMHYIIYIIYIIIFFSLSIFNKL